MDNREVQRRRLQFSLRKLMLWTLVWAVCLGLLRWAGLETRETAFAILGLGSLVLIRITLGVDRGMVVSVIASLILMMPIGVPAFVVVSLVVWAVDKIDLSMRSKTPEEP